MHPRARSLPGKEQLLPWGAAKFFTEPQYNPFPAIFVRLNAIDPGQLRSC